MGVMTRWDNKPPMVSSDVVVATVASWLAATDIAIIVNEIQFLHVKMVENDQLSMDPRPPCRYHT